MIQTTRTWAEIDLDAAAHNLEEIKKYTKSKILAIVKSDAYGHGSVEMARFFLDRGVHMLGVATVDEAIHLRNHDIEAPILVLAQPGEETVKVLLDKDITTTAYTLEFAKALSDEAKRQKKRAHVHIKIDTGMNRIGLMAKDEKDIDTAEQIAKLDNIFAEGIFTHFSMADEDAAYTARQYELFLDVCDKLSRRGVEIPIKHACNSAALILHPEMHLDMVRPGLILYGLYPAEGRQMKKLKLTPVMSIKSRISNIKRVSAGERISYGGTYVTEKEEMIATVPIGYADGYSRALSGKVSMEINNSRVKVVGNICMDQCMIDVTNVQNIQVGDEVLIFGKSKNGHVPVEELAKMLGTINYEPPCLIAKRVPRIYIMGDEVISAQSNLV